jgi:hypothetical protein
MPSLSRDKRSKIDMHNKLSGFQNFTVEKSPILDGDNTTRAPRGREIGKVIETFWHKFSDAQMAWF